MLVVISFSRLPFRRLVNDAVRPAELGVVCVMTGTPTSSSVDAAKCRFQGTASNGDGEHCFGSHRIQRGSERGRPIGGGRHLPSWERTADFQGNPGPADPNAAVHWRPWQPRKLRRIPSTTKHPGPLGDLPAIVVAGVPVQIKRKKNHETEDDFP
jgi:hypothetical protein